MNEIVFAIILVTVFVSFFGGIVCAQQIYLKRVTRLIALLQEVYDAACDHPDFKIHKSGSVEAAAFNLVMWIRHVSQAR